MKVGVGWEQETCTQYKPCNSITLSSISLSFGYEVILSCKIHNQCFQLWSFVGGGVGRGGGGGGCTAQLVAGLSGPYIENMLVPSLNTP